MTDAEQVEADFRLAERLRTGRVSKADMCIAADRLEKLNDEVERWVNSYQIAADRAMMNGQLAADREPVTFVPITPAGGEIAIDVGPGCKGLLDEPIPVEWVPINTRYPPTRNDS